MKNRKINKYGIVCVWLLFFACVEPYDIKTIEFESALVIEATITSEHKTQVIKVSRTYALDENQAQIVLNAQVHVVDDLQNTYSFYESSPGIYSSETAFHAVADREYQLKIRTSDGRSYASNNTQLTVASTIDNVYAEKAENESGINIFVDSYNPSGNARYYRYNYEETYKIEAPKYTVQDLIVLSDKPPYKVAFEFKTEDKRTCYNTIYSRGIIQTETNHLTEDRVSRFKVRFIDKEDFILQNRYSILVKQYVQNREAFSFYQALNDMSESENLFSQNQPGFINGNLYSETSTDERVIGFFEVVSVASKRIFFNPTDILKVGPPYISPCTYSAPLMTDKSGRSPLVEALQTGKFRYFVENDGTSIEDIVEPGGPYVLVPAECGDCTTIGTNIVPDFWEN